MNVRPFVWKPALLLAALLVVGKGAEAHAQYSAQQPGVPTMPGPQRQTEPHLPGVIDDKAPPDPFKDRMDAARTRSLQDDRRKHLEADAAKLLALATELKAEVDKTSKDELSVTVVKKAAEMEKLAHDLKERMRN